VSAKNDVLLLLDPKRRQLIPLARIALAQGQGSHRKLMKSRRDDLILDHDGSIRRFDAIEIIGPQGENFLSEVFRFFLQSQRLIVRLSEPLEYDLEFIKDMLLDIAVNHSDIDDGWLSERESKMKIIDSIQLAESVADIMKRMPFARTRR
jgi:hypothetical protein